MGDLSRRCLVDGGAAASEPDIPDLGEIGAEIWAVAEETAKEVMCCVHPTLDSEEKRRDVIEYLQRLIRTSLGCEVFPYGSVPLKTYLPDGDIDLTAVTSLTAVDTSPRDVLAVLQAQESNQYADYEVKDTQFIDAEVKLVKCLVENIVIDLSFNQLGGISTLCFLEQVDRCVGKNHLFKRSIILVKAWCYYESRILGAHHSLISTYAMETLVLYIFHLFHASLDGPLAVLYKFLDYFSKFDWDNYCISLNGPVSVSCLPDIVVEMTHGVQSDYLLSKEFLRNCLDVFSVPFEDADTKLHAFSPKHLNIIDPLKENNNLGRSVNRGNFYRIRSAFRYGAQKLGRIFTLPRERIADQIKRFFANTFKRPGRNNGNLGRSFYSRSFSHLESNTSGVSDLDRCSTEINHIPMASMMGQTTGEMGVSLSHSADEMYPRPANYWFDCSASAMYSNDFISQYYTPCFQSFPESWKFENWTFNEGKQTKSIHEKKYSYSLIGEKGENHLRSCGLGCYRSDNYDRLSNFGSGVMSPDGSASEDLALDQEDLVDIAESRDNLNPLSDLSGDYDNNIRSLLYGQSWLRHLLFGYLMPYPPPTFGLQFVRKSTAHRSMSMTHCSSSRFIDNRVNLAWATQSVIIPGQSNPALCTEPKHNKPRGTRTCLPNGYAWRETPSPRMGMSHGPGNYRQCQHAQSALIVPEKKSSDIGGGDTGHEQLPRSPSPALHLEKTEIPQESNTSAFDGYQTCDFFSDLQKLEFGSLGNLPDVSSLRASDTSSGWGSIPSQVKSAKLLFGSNNERVGKQSYHLKDEDFPPLTV